MDYHRLPCAIIAFLLEEGKEVVELEQLSKTQSLAHLVLSIMGTRGGSMVSINAPLEAGKDPRAKRIMSDAEARRTKSKNPYLRTSETRPEQPINIICSKCRSPQWMAWYGDQWYEYQP